MKVLQHHQLAVVGIATACLSLSIAASAAGGERAFELVSPADDLAYDVQTAQVFPAPTWGARRTTTDGAAAVFHLSINGTLPGMAVDGDADDSVVARRSGEAFGWPWSAPLGDARTVSTLPAYAHKDLSEDGRRMLIQSGSQLDGRRLGPTAADGTPLDQQDARVLTGSIYVVDVTSGEANYVSGQYDTSGPVPRTGTDANYYYGGSSSLSTVYFGTPAALLPGVTAATGNAANVYRRTGGTTTLVTRRADGTSFASPGTGDAFKQGAVSRDGHAYSLTAPAAGTMVAGDTNTVSDVYQVRDDGSVIWASQTQFDPSVLGSQTPANRTWEATSDDGDTIVFSTTEKLVGNGSTTGDRNTVGDLYAYDVPSGDLVRVALSDPSCAGATPNPCNDNLSNTGGANASVAKLSILSGDGNRIFFISGNVLHPADTDGQQSLYVRDLDAGTTTYIAPAGIGATSATTGADAGGAVPNALASTYGSLVANPVQSRSRRRPIAVTPDGSVAAFLLATNVDLPAARGGNDADGVRDLYVWRDGDGLRRVRQGIASDANTATIPSLGCALGATDLGQVCRALTQSGDRVFFQTTDALVDGDTNGLLDVYEYDTASGQVALVSRGDLPFASTYYDSSSDGDTVFFTTAATLDPSRDRDLGYVDLYAARRGGGFPAPPDPPVPCNPLSGNCEGPIAEPPLLPGATTPTFAGPGNAVPPQAPAAAKITVAKPKTVRGNRVSLRVKIPGKGRLRTSGSGLARTSRAVSKSGTYTVRIALSKRARATLKRKRRVTATVRVTFTPAGGSATTARARLVFQAPATKKQGR